jgi:hypothetical protein
MYTVRLFFAELEQDAAGRRVFDIRVQGQVVAEDFDVFQEAGGEKRAVVKAFPGIEAGEEICVEFVPEDASVAADRLPVLQGIELERERVLTLGVSVPSFLLNDAEPESTAEMVIVNNKDTDFSGTLKLDVPDGFAVTPPETKIELPAGERKTLPLSAAVRQKGEAAEYAVGIRLIRADGTAELERTAELEYLGDLRRAVLKAVEDTHAFHSAPTRNYATSAALNVDGGDAEMGDHHHSIGYLKFRLAVDGKPVSAMLRLYNAGNPTGNSGQIRLVKEPWAEKQVTYDKQPELGDVLAKIGPVAENQVVELPLDVELKGNQEVSLAIDPTGCDGVNYISREGGKPAEFVVEYVK